MGVTSFEISGGAIGGVDGGFVGVTSTLARRISSDSAAFLTGNIGHKWGSGRSGLEWEVLGGLRMRF